MSDDEGRSPASAGEDGPSPTDGPDDGTASGTDGPTGAGSREPSAGTPLRTLLDADEGAFRTLLDADGGAVMVVRETLVSVAIVGVIGLLLFGMSGVWPPMVAVESGSMEPHMHRGDLVFVSEPGRYVPAESGDRGVVTRAEGERIGYRTFGGYGSVIVYDSPVRGGPPVIHRAHFWVADDENWYAQADPAYHHAASCQDLPNCPAPHAGFITKGDANSQYDQANGISGPVRPAWIDGIAHVRVPYLGYVRLWLAGGNGPLVVGTTDGVGSVVGPRAGAAPGAGDTATDTVLDRWRETVVERRPGERRAVAG